MTDTTITTIEAAHAEQSLLGALMIDNACYDDIADIVANNDFARHHHSALYRAITDLAEADQPFDIVTLADTLTGNDQLEAVGGLPYIGRLANETASSANAVHYARMVRDTATLRRLHRACLEGAECAASGHVEDPAAMAAGIEASIVRAVERRGEGGPVIVGSVVPGVLSELDRLHQHGGPVPGLRTGLADLDRTLSGLRAGQLIIVGARPGVGKTVFGLGMAVQAAMQEGRPALVCSLEMTREEVVQRAIAMTGRVPLSGIRTGRLTDEQWQSVTQTTGEIAECPLYIDDSAGVTSADIRARARRLKRQCGDLALVVVDYLQLMGDAKHAETRALALAQTTRALKQFAKEIGAPVVALSQLNRNLEARANPRPMLADLRESGAIEQDADIVLMLYRPETGPAEIIIAKHRNGPVGTIKAAFSGDFVRFDNYTRGFAHAA